MVHIWHTEKPMPDQPGQNQTDEPFPKRPAAIGLFRSCLACFCLAWKSLDGLENRRPFTRSQGWLPAVASPSHPPTPEHAPRGLAPRPLRHIPPFLTQ